MNARHWLIPLSAAVLVACAKAPPPAAGDQTAALLQRDSAWSAAASEGKDVEKIVSYWSDDAVLMPDAQPALEGKAAIRAYITESLKIPGFHIHWVSRNPKFSNDGTMAWMLGDSEVTMTGPDGKPSTMHVRGMTVWRLDKDNVWRCVLDTGNNPPPPVPPKKA
jgi:ketosteroid isomerase-like protein